MNSEDDKKRRKAARLEIFDLGHFPIGWEDLPPKILYTTAAEECLRIVREDSDMLLAIIDDTVSDIIKKEIEEAIKTHGEEKIFYFFTDDHDKRDESACALWAEVTKLSSKKYVYVVKEFSNISQLRKCIKRVQFSETSFGVKLEIIYHSKLGGPITVEINNVLIGDFHSDEIIPWKHKRGPLTIVISSLPVWGTLSVWSGQLSAPMRIDMWPDKKSVATFI